MTSKGQSIIWIDAEDNTHYIRDVTVVEIEYNEEEGRYEGIYQKEGEKYWVHAGIRDGFWRFI